MAKLALSILSTGTHQPADKARRGHRAVIEARYSARLDVSSAIKDGFSAGSVEQIKRAFSVVAVVDHAGQTVDIGKNSVAGKVRPESLSDCVHATFSLSS